MEHKEVKMSNFSYDLPEEKIAKYPLAERDASKLLVFRNGKINEDTYLNIDHYFSEKTLLIFNNTKVIQARLHFKNSNGASIEIFCLEPGEENQEPATAMTQKKSVVWKCLIGKAGKWKEKKLSITFNNLTLNAEIKARNESSFDIEFSWEPGDLSFAEILEQLGEMPIPPYLKRESEQIDLKRYQTVYANEKGSVAAPTAGLHFTDRIFEKLKSKHIQTEYVTLHVSAGTFKPVKSETIEGHDMHSEWIEVQTSFIENIIHHFSSNESGYAIVAIGTTSLRTIETLYWMGVKAKINAAASLLELEIKQWDAYELPQNISLTDSLNALLNWCRKNNLIKLICKTQILIVPTYKLKIANALVTNFHQPSSTLMLLVAAVVGEEWKLIYNYALNNDFRFLSYGDGSLLFSNK